MIVACRYPCFCAVVGLIFAGCLGFTPSDPPAATLRFGLALPSGATATVVAYDADDRPIGELAHVAADRTVELRLAANLDHDGIRLVARSGAVVLKALVPHAERDQLLDLGQLDAASTAATQLIQEKVSGQGGALASIPVSALAALQQQIADPQHEAVQRFAALVAQLLEAASPQGTVAPFSDLDARLEPSFVAAVGLPETLAAQYGALLAEAVAQLTIELTCDAALIRVMFTVDASGQALDGNGAPQLVRQPTKSGVFVAITVDETSPVTGERALKPQMVPNDPETAMFDDGTGGDEVAGDGVYTRSLVLPRGLRVKYKYTNGSAGEGWTRTEEWPGNARILEVRDLLTRHADGTPDCLVIRRDAFGDEASNKNRVNLHRAIKGGALDFARDLGGDTASAVADGVHVGGLRLGDLRQVPPLTPAGVPEAAENGICTRCPPPLTISADDQTPPRLLSAEFVSTGRIVVRFSEAMEYTSASATANYQVLDDSGRALAITQAGASGSQTILDVAPPDFGQRYTVRVKNLVDASANHNPLTSGSEVAVEPDRTPPEVVTVRAGALRELNATAEVDDPTVGQVVVVTFNEELDPQSAESIANYRISDPAGLPLQVQAAYLRQQRQVWLVTAQQKKRRAYDLTVSGVRDLARNRLRGGDALRFSGFALFRVTFGAVPGFAFLDPSGSTRGLPPGEGLYLTGTALSVARDLHGDPINVSGRTDLTGLPDFEMLPGDALHAGQPIYELSLLLPPGSYAWKVAHGIPGEHVDPPPTLVKVHKSLCTTNDATGVNIDPVTLLALPWPPGATPQRYLDYRGARLSVDGEDPPGPFVTTDGSPPRPALMYRRENPDEVCTVLQDGVRCAPIVVGTWRDIEAFRVGEKTNDYDDGLPEVDPVRLAPDRSAPRLRQLAVRDSESLLLTFDERVTVDPAAIALSARHAREGTSLPVQFEAAGVIGEALLPHQILLRTAPMATGAAYRLSLTGIADAAGNALRAPLEPSWVAPATYQPFTPLADSRPPRVLAVVPQSPTALLVRFDEPVDPASAVATTSYRIEAQQSGLQVTDAAMQGPSAVLLATATQTIEADYTLVIRAVSDRATPPNTLVEQRVPFRGFGDARPPALRYAVALSSTSLALGFDEAISAASAQSPTSYEIPGLTVLAAAFSGDPARKAAAFAPAATAFADDVVVLETSSMTAGQAYSVSAPGVTDLSGNSAQGSTRFDARADPPLVDVVLSYRIAAGETVAGRIPPRAIDPGTLAAQREGVFIRGSTVSSDGKTKGSATDPVNQQLGGFPPEGEPLTGPDPQLLDDGQGGDLQAGDAVHTIRIRDVPLGTSIQWKAFASYTVAYKNANPGDPKAAFADATPGPAVFSDGQEFPGNENAVRILGDLDGDGVVRIEVLFGDETTYKKLTDEPPFVWIVDDVRWVP